jgi:hypothetical protein
VSGEDRTVPIPPQYREKSFVQILARNTRKVVGVGFVVSPQHVMTCCHVIAAALTGCNEVPWEPPAGIVAIELPHVAPGRELQGRPVLWGPQTSGGPRFDGDVPQICSDWAVLDMGHRLPGLEPVVISTADAFDHRFWTFGVPQDRQEGTTVEGKIAARVLDGAFELLADTAHLAYVRAGFSGGAVWDKTTVAVAGMMVAISDDTAGTPSAYMIPIASLLAGLGGLGIVLTDLGAGGSARPMGRRWGLGLQHFADRINQTVAAADALHRECGQRPCRPVVCVVHGHTKEAHESLIERFRLDASAAASIRKDENHGGLNIESIEWPRLPGRRTNDAMNALRLQLKHFFLINNSEPGTVAGAINNQVGPNALAFEIGSSNFQSHQQALLEQWLQYWNEISRCGLTRPVVLFACFRYEPGQQPSGLFGFLWPGSTIPSFLMQINQPLSILRETGCCSLIIF